MIEGFLSGHLYLRRDVPPAFLKLSDPYDPAQNGPFRDPPYYLYDLSYYRGRIYAYFGAAPAVLLFLPYHLLTGSYLSYKAAGAIFAGGAFLILAGLLEAARRRYAPAMPVWLLALGLVALGLTSCLPSLLARIDVWEIPVAAVIAFTAGALLCLWLAWHRPEHRPGWLAGASLALGLAVASRPTALVLAPLLGLFLWEAPAAPGPPLRRRALLGWAALPLAGCLLLIAAYNWGRFGNVLDSGHSYQLAGGQYESRIRFFSLSYLWDNLRIYYLFPAPWVRRFPFVGEAGTIPMSPGHSDAELTFGLLVNLPLAWCGLAALPSARRRDGFGFAVRAALYVAAAEAGLFLFFFGANIRYEIEFVVPLMLLAVLGLVGTEAGAAPRPWFRAGWLGLAALSAAFALGHAAHRGIKAREDSYGWTMSHRQPRAALAHIGMLLRIEPGNARYHNDRGVALAVAGEVAGAAREFEAAIRLDPAYSGAHCNLGLARLAQNDPAGALPELRESLRLDPSNAGARSALALAEEALAARRSAAGR